MPELPPRVLAPSESVFVVSGATVAQHCYGTGVLNEAALEDALAGLVDRYPLLGGRIHMSRRGFELRFAPRRRPAAVFLDVGAADIEDYPMAGKSALPIGQVCSLRVCRSGDKFRVTLLLHHAIADADAALAYFHDFWTLYTERMRTPGNPGRQLVAAHPIPASSETLLRARGYAESASRQVMDLRPAYRGPESIWTALRPRRAERARIHLSVEQTDRLLGIGRTHGVTLNGLVSAALALVEREMSGKDRLSVAISSFVNLRGRIDPPVAPTGGTNVLGIAEMILDVDRRSDVLDLARQVIADIRNGLETTRIHQTVFVRGGDVRRALALARRYFLLVPAGGLVPTFTAIQITNWGRVSEFTTPDGVDIGDFRCGVELHAVSAFIATQGLAMVEGRIYFVTSYNGRLSIDFTNLTAGGDAVRRVEHILQFEIEKLIPATVFD
ncbi:phthiocerol/phthiodiolone dimycocerosyl transferase family protein [Mycobacteroides abscessus]|uniref:phthiocerol/phthiodiolone dimycocerosyl transferase family protein n=1 Tax=Mycobacteroides abscessus TaxID=36809 RepID=UPI000D9F4A34|nr:acyltransferase [Mycobacteroides abscessus]SPX87955.1 putative polyketide synthase associated protein [Mycobacteroides abscessus]